jgi:hypothetical protein
MESRRTRSAGRPRAEVGLAEADLFDRLATVLERATAEPRRAAPEFKAPTFDGKGDVEIFIAQFTEVAEANEWEGRAILLHLREALKDGAKDCGRSPYLDSIFTALRARFGLSPREARARLSGLRRDNNTPLQEHASEVERLVGIAYADLPRHNQDSMVVDTFCSTLGNAYLQRHLLAVPTRTLEEAVRAGNEFLQIKLYQPRGTVHQIGEEEPEGQATAVQVESSSIGVEALLLKVIQQLSDKLDLLHKAPSTPVEASRPTGRDTVCWGCRRPGHTRRRCPTHPWNQVTNNNTRKSGNDISPQQ